jgi:hypothetical protein
VAEVVLDLDSAGCPHIFEGELALARAPRLTLRCVMAAPPPSTTVTAAVLLCQPQGDRPMELDPQVVESIAPSGWFKLGSGNGLQVWVTGRPAGAQKGDDVKATLKSADQPLTLNAWNEAF